MEIEKLKEEFSDLDEGEKLQFYEEFKEEIEELNRKEDAPNLMVMFTDKDGEIHSADAKGEDAIAIFGQLQEKMQFDII